MEKVKAEFFEEEGIVSMPPHLAQRLDPSKYRMWSVWEFGRFAIHVTREKIQRKRRATDIIHLV